MDVEKGGLSTPASIHLKSRTSQLNLFCFIFPPVQALVGSVERPSNLDIGKQTSELNLNAISRQ